MKRLFYILTFLFLSLTAMAVNIPAGTKLYLKPNSNWKSDGARFAAYFFGNEDAWVSMTDSDGDGIYSCTSPNGSYLNVIFCRMNPSASANNWSNKWNQTSDLTYDGTNNCYTVKEGTWDKGGGTWSLIKSLTANKYIYFEKPNDWNTPVIQFMIGHNSHSEGYEMTKISNTNIYYWKTVSWEGYTEWAVFGTDAVWKGEGSSITNRKQWAPKSTAVGTKSITASYNLITTAGAIGSTGTQYTFLNKTHTIKTQLDGADDANVGDVSTTYYELTAVSTTTKQTSSITSTSSGTISVVYTSQVTLEATPADGYVFVGWYIGNDLLSSEQTYSYEAKNENTTIEARFRHKWHMYYNLPIGWAQNKTLNLMLGHATYSNGYVMSKIENTSLYYECVAPWSDNTEWAIFNVDSHWGEDNTQSVSKRSAYASEKTKIGTNGFDRYNLLNEEGTFDKLSDYSKINHTLTIDATTGGSVSADSYKLKTANTTEATTGTSSIVAAYTAIVTLRATPADGYRFDGWYSGSTLLSDGLTYKYQAGNSDATIIAKFIEEATPQITSFTASAKEIIFGDEITFSVEVENAESKDVVYKHGEKVISNPWIPDECGVYTITANLDGATSKLLDVTVYAAIYFNNTNSSWSKVYAYCWNTEADKNATWPGIELTNPIENVYTYKTTKAYENVIFNNNSGEQTPDFVFKNKKTYSMPNPIVVGVETLCGTSWDVSNEDNRMERKDGVLVKIFREVPAGTYNFKVFYNNQWLGFEKVNTEKSMECEGVRDGDGDDDKNIQFTLATPADVLISYNKTDGKIILKTIFKKATKYYFTPRNEGTRYAVYLFGEGGTNTWVGMTKEYSHIYSFEMPEGEWDGLIYCEMNGENNEWGNNGSNVKAQTADLRYDGENDWYVWGVDNDYNHDNDSYWRKFENLIFAGQKLYFKPDANWESNKARFVAYYWDVVDENAWADCVYNEEGHVYEVVAPTQNDPNCAWINMKFVRMNPNTEENNFSDGVKWNETSNLTFDGENDFFLIKLTEKNNQGNWDWDTADPNNWIKFSNPFKNVIFFEPNQSLKDAESKRFSVYFWNGFGENCWAKMQEMTNPAGVYYIVIPDGYWTGANICSMNPSTEDDNWDKNGDDYINIWNQTDNLTYHADKLLYKVPDTWNFKEPEDTYWDIFTLPNDELEIKDGVNNGAYYQKMEYTMEISGSEVKKWHWISLPYDVNVKDIESNITAKDPYGTDFIMKRYDTANRAAWTGKKPPVKDSTWVQLDATDVLKAGRGYILGVNTSDTYKENGVTLTFPAADDFHVVNDVVTDNNTALNAKHPENDNWYLIGTGLYGETGTRSGAKPVNYVAYPTESGSDYTYHCFVENDWANLDPAFQEQLGTGVGKLEKYKAFFVQHSGEYSFSKAVTKQNMAPRRARAEEVVEQYYINIVGEKDTARTAIFLADDGTDEYVVGKDFLHFGVTGQTAQLYTKQASSLLAFNHLKRENRVVDLGGYMVNAGEYTISMMDNGEALVVLIDNYTGESVDLTADSYTFTTEKGSLDGRFSLVISYVEKDVTTEIGNEMAGDLVVSNNGGLVVVDGLSVGSVVWIYDAVGRCVDRFVADSEQQELNICAGVYVLKTSTESVKFVVW